MPSTYSVSNCRPCESSTVITPSLPTLSNTSAIRLPISRSCAETEATLAMPSLLLILMACFLISSEMALVAASMPRFRIMGLAPGPAVVGDGGGAEFTIEGNIAAFGPQGGDHCFGHRVHAGQQVAAGFFRKSELFRHR